MITYAITVADEEFEFKRLINGLQPYIFENEEIVILADSNKITDVIKKQAEIFKIKINYFNFQKNFSDYKNELFNLSSKQYLFQIDADEQVPPSLLFLLRSIAKNNNSIDLLWIPRINILNGLSEKEIKEDREKNKMGWRGFPDFQARFVKNNGKIKWKGEVHEILTGASNPNFINQNPIELYSILHVKSKEKQISQNIMYSEILESKV